MAEPFLAEIRIVSFNIVPKGWARCDGQLMPILQNQALFSLLGTTFGGNGQMTFALPDARGRVPIHFGNGYTLGARGGTQSHTLSMSEMPGHAHGLRGSSASAATNNPTGAVLAASTAVYHSASQLAQLNVASVTSAGGGQPHENRQPFLALGFCIALQGIFPSRS